MQAFLHSDNGEAELMAWEKFVFAVAKTLAYSRVQPLTRYA
jgi:hypothetical protein